MSSEDPDLELIAEYTAGLFKKYEQLKAGQPSVPFWDLVVVCCTPNARLEAAWSRCLASSSLPPSAIYRVMTDPPGPSVEGGGATMHALQQLSDQYGSKLDSMKVLMIHSGGSSKRLPQHAVLGKLLSPLPAGGSGCSMLELKLVMYLPYAALMPPGVLVSGCDDIQLAWLPASLPGDLFDGDGEEFVVPAHPAPAAVAVNHGVYVLPPVVEKRHQYCYSSPCEEVLQKPSLQLMRDRGAVFLDGGRETVHIDGAFWLGRPAVRRLLQLWRRLQPLQEEISAYRDMLQCLGRRQDSHYRAVAAGLPPQSPRALTHSLLSGAPLQALVLPRSRFFHLGTVTEYLEHVAGGGALAAALRLRRRSCSVAPRQAAGVVMNSVVSEQTQLPESSLLEYCRLEGAVRVGQGSLLSHVHLAGPAEVPAGLLLHTAAVSWRGRCQHVTVAFGVSDDMKSGCGLLGGELVTGESAPPSSGVTLWTARLFPCAETMVESAASTLALVSAGPPYRTSDQLWSMHDVMQHRDPLAMLDFREGIVREVGEENEATAGGR